MRYKGFPNIQTGLDDTLVASKLGFAKSLVGIAQKIQGRTQKPFVRLKRNIDGILVDVLAFHDQSIISMRRAEDEEDEAPARVVPSRLVWMPEGFALWPKHPDFPQGWGLSAEGEGGALAGGPLPMVLVNRQANNNYPDQFDPTHQPAPFFYMPWEDDGSAPDGGRIGLKATPTEPFAPQFSRRWQQLIKEEDASEWFCHWPEVMTFDPLRQGCLDRTNTIRSSASVDPVYPALRGVYHGAGEFVRRQMQITTVQGHNYSGYLPGHETTASRFVDRAAYSAIGAGGENLQTMVDGGFGEYDTGVQLAYNWSGSSEHYPIMVAEYNGTSGALPYVGFMGLGVGRGTTAFQITGDTAVGIPPVTGYQAAQVFYATDRNLASLRAYWRGDAGTVSWHAVNSCKYASIHTDYEFNEVIWPTWVAYRNTLAICGRVKPLWILGEEEADVRGVVSAALHFASDTDLRLRVCTLNLAKQLQLWDGPAHASWASFSVIASIDLTVPDDGAEDVMAISRPIFSPNGAKCVVPLDRRINHTGPALRQHQINFGATPDGTAVVAGTVIDFMEFSGAGFTKIHRSEVYITPTTITTTDIGGGAKRNDYVETCIETYHWLADYNASNVLVWADVELNITLTQYAEYMPTGTDYIVYPSPGKASVSEQQALLTFEQNIVFPGGTELLSAEFTIDNWRATGFVLCLHTLDILSPNETCYTKQLLGNAAVDNDKPSVGVELWWRGTKIKEKAETTLGAAGPDVPNALWEKGCSWGGGIVEISPWTTIYTGGGNYFAFAHPRGVAYDLDTSPSDAAGPYPYQRRGDCVQDPYPAVIAVGRIATRVAPHACSDASSFVSPILMFRYYDDNSNYHVDLNMWSYGGEWVLSGYYVNPIPIYPEQGFWEPEVDRRLWRATFDLATAIGRPVGNDIEPVGVV